MADIQIKITNLREIKSAFRQAPAEMTKELTVAIRRSIFSIGADSRRNTPVKQGRLRASHYEKFSPLRGEVGTNVNYDKFVHDGTRPHIIRAKAGKALYWKGARHPVKSVRHPGFKGKPYLRMAVDSNRGTVDHNFKQAVENVLAGIARRTN